eukprot:scaffold323161_cov24-Tisochrysis_lutea.AAC.1
MLRTVSFQCTQHWRPDCKVCTQTNFTKPDTTVAATDHLPTHTAHQLTHHLHLPPYLKHLAAAPPAHAVKLLVPQPVHVHPVGVLQRAALRLRQALWGGGTK